MPNQVIGLVLTVMSIDQLKVGLHPRFAKYPSVDTVAFSAIIAALEFYVPSPELVRLALDSLIKAGVDVRVVTQGAAAISYQLANGPAVPPRRTPKQTTAYSCEVLGCEVSFDDPSKLRDHMRRQHARAHICKICSRHFQHAKDVRRHCESIHAKTEPIMCLYCGKRCTRKDNYDRHVRTVHKHHSLRHGEMMDKALRPIRETQNRTSSRQKTPSISDGDHTPESLPEEESTLTVTDPEVSMLPEYSFSKLAKGEIRILRLDPCLNMSSGTIVPSGRLFTKALAHSAASDHPTASLEVEKEGIGLYKALSYVWGPHDSEEKLMVLHDGEKRGTLRIRSNLHRALLRLSNVEITPIWEIDALCINQANMEEKSLQVALMGDIYRNASSVVVWLGDQEKEHGTNVLASIERLLAPETVVERDDPEEPTYENVFHLLRNPWFSRLWVIQEVCLARDVRLYDGESTISWNDLSLALSMASATAYRHRSLRNTVSDLGFLLVELTSLMFRRSNTGEIAERVLSLDKLVPHLASFEVSDPKDAIFALLGLTKYSLPRYEDGPSLEQFMEVCSISSFPRLRLVRSLLSLEKQQTEVEGRSDVDHGRLRHNVTNDGRQAKEPQDPSAFLDVDYNKSFVEICVEFFVKIITRTRSLDLLCHTWARVKADESCPSWLRKSEVPRGRSVPHSLLGLPVLSHKSRSNYNACGGLPAVFLHDVEKTTASGLSVLSVLGFHIGSIESVHDESHTDFWIIPQSWRQLLTSADSQALLDQSWKLLVANRDNRFDEPPRYWESYHRRLLHSDLSDADLTKLVKEGGDDVERCSYLRRLSNVLTGRRLAQTHSGSLVLGPSELKRGDKVVVLLGCTAPLILRQVSVETRPSHKRRRPQFDPQGGERCPSTC